MVVITRQCVYYCYLAAGAGVAGFLQAWGFSLLSERLSNRTRRAYLEALLATEVGFYDSASSGELVRARVAHIWSLPARPHARATRLAAR